MPRVNPRYRTRRSFTLLELLVVLTLITVLLALLTGTVVRTILTVQKSNTQTALTKVQSALNRQWVAYKDQYWKEDAQRLYPQQWAAVLAIAGNDPKRARVIWVKLRQKQTFPTTFNEALTPINLGGGVTLNPLPTYVSALSAAGIAAADSGACQSSACLLLALQQSPSGGGVKLEDLGVNTSIQPLTTTNGKQINALVDAFGSPLQFCRWPTKSANLGNSAAGLPGAANDPTDAEGTLTVQTWLGSSGAASFVALCHLLPPRSQQGPMSNRLVPLVASAGPDKQLGLDPGDFSSQGTGADNDNLYGVQ
jgi:prepilin-type N-terminal cleavage/methylation domain-containing protein